MTQRKRILVLESEKLLMASIANLLAPYPELSVTQTSADSISCLWQSGGRPTDVIILDEAILEANLAAFITILPGQQQLRLLVFHLEDETVQALDRKVIQITETGDFLELL